MTFFRIASYLWVSLCGVCFLACLVGCRRDELPDAGPMLDAESERLVLNDFESSIRFDDNQIANVNPAFLPTAASPCRPPALVRVEDVTDGDTIYVVGIEQVISAPVRMIGVDTPEVGRDGFSSECYGDEAAAFTQQLQGHSVWLTFDNECFDQFNRLLAYVHLGTGEADLWERQLLRRGYADNFPFGDNRSFAQQFANDANQAAVDGAGLWSVCR